MDSMCRSSSRANGNAHEFASLADACRAANSGQVIELRYNGPLLAIDNEPIWEPPIVLTAKHLTIRAGEGFRPLLRFRPVPIDTRQPSGAMSVSRGRFDSSILTSRSTSGLRSTCRPSSIPRLSSIEPKASSSAGVVLPCEGAVARTRSTRRRPPRPHSFPSKMMRTVPIRHPAAMPPGFASTIASFGVTPSSSARHSDTNRPGVVQRTVCDEPTPDRADSLRSIGRRSDRSPDRVDPCHGHAGTRVDTDSNGNDSGIGTPFGHHLPR